MILNEHPLKQVLRTTYGVALGLHSILGFVLPRKKTVIRVYYGGARSGDIGGPLVKVKRLQKKFPEDFWRYNLVYCLSNTPYLPGFALNLCKKRNIPIVHNQNGVFYPGWYGGDYKIQNARMARSYHVADHVFFQSMFCRLSAERFLGKREGPSEILYNAIDTEQYTPREKYCSLRGPFTFLLTGKINIHLMYRVESSIRGLAFAQSLGLDCQLNVAGWLEPFVLKTMADLAIDLGVQDSVYFSGPYTQEDAPDIYRNAHAYIMTKHNDPCPNTVLEALASGLPILYSRSGGVEELVGYEAGIGLDCEHSWEKVCVPSNEEIGEAMVAIATQAPGMSLAARKRAMQHFDIKHWLKRHCEVFQSLLT